MGILSIASGIISLIGTVPYIRDTIRGYTKPRVASWLVWGILTGIAAAASFSQGHTPAGALAACMTLSCLLVTVLALKKTGSASLEKFDIGCLAAALAGAILWQWFNSPEIAVLAVVAIDAVASLPTIRHAYRAPDEETLFEFVMAGLASIVALAATTDFAITAVLYPLYIIVFDFTVATLIIRGRRKLLS